MNKLKALSLSDWLVVAGAALMLVFGLARWFSWEVNVDEVVVVPKDTSNAFDYLLTGVVPWLLVVGAGVVTLLLATEALRPGNVPWPLVLVIATLLGFVLVLVRLILGHDLETGEGADLDQSRGHRYLDERRRRPCCVRRGVHRLSQHRSRCRLRAGGRSCTTRPGDPSAGWHDADALSVRARRRCRPSTGRLRSG